LSYLRNACALNVAIQYLAILKYVYTRTIYSKMKQVPHRQNSSKIYWVYRRNGAKIDALWEWNTLPLTFLSSNRYFN